MTGPIRITGAESSGLEVAIQRDAKGRAVGIDVTPIQRPKGRTNYGGPMTVSTVIDWDVYKRFKIVGIMSSRKINDTLREAIMEWLERHETTIDEGDRGLKHG